MDPNNLMTYLTVMCFFKEAHDKGLIDEREFVEIERNVAVRCSIPDKSVYKILISDLLKYLFM